MGGKGCWGEIVRSRVKHTVTRHTHTVANRHLQIPSAAVQIEGDNSGLREFITGASQAYSHLATADTACDT